jgi:4-hydroxythreonine-4-phosphate dehydrogenase
MKAVAPIALTCGDPAGVGPEIIRNWLMDNKTWASRVHAIGPPDWLEALPCEGTACECARDPLSPGKPTANGARVAWEALTLAAKGCEAGTYSAVVTGPVSKGQLQSIGFPFPGQTEFFADAWGGTPSMAFAGKELKVVLATWHEPLSDIPGRFYRDHTLLERAILHAAEWAELEGVAEPRIAVCGLNPHAGEGGLMGSEEKNILNPKLKVLRKIYPGLTECLPADTVFHRQREGEFDYVVALYHDQALIPVKTLEFHHAVNVTLGLKHIRTSPDHGTAFSIAGKGVAQAGSLDNAIHLARRYAELRSRVES